MKYLQQLAVSFWREEEGVTATEYAVMLAVITLTCVVSIGFLGDGVVLTFNTIVNALPF
jgi:pilus assembly protein Flp/PilA